MKNPSAPLQSRFSSRRQFLRQSAAASVKVLGFPAINADAASLVRRAYRDGWKVPGLG